MDTKKQFDIPLHDIKPIVEVQEYSFYYLLGVIALVIALACGIAYFLYVWYKKRNAFNERKHNIKQINSLDLSDTKNSAYAITSYGYIFKDDSPKHAEIFKNLTERLEDYKYKKSVKAFDDETLRCIELYKGMLDV